MDEIVYELLLDGAVIVRKTSSLDIDYLNVIESTLNEWKSEEEEHAYKNLNSVGLSDSPAQIMPKK